MKVPDDVRARYPTQDVDTEAFLNIFDEPEGAKVIEVGAHDEEAANILAECGFAVYGVDLREYDLKLTPCRYTFLRHDWCQMPEEFWREHRGTFDVFVSLSAIEHFGLGTYDEDAVRYHVNYDVLALRYAWDVLRWGGTAYITVPFGAQFLTMGRDWRVYDRRAVEERLAQDFTTVYAGGIMSGEGWVDGKLLSAGTPVSLAAAMRYPGEPPHLTGVFKFRKDPKNRLAPDGR